MKAFSGSHTKNDWWYLLNCPMGVIIVTYGVGKLESWNDYIREDESCDRRKQLQNN